MNKEQIIKYIPDFDYIEEANALENQFTPAYHATVMLKNGNSLGSGFHEDKLIARKIAICEAIERQAFKNLAGSTEFSDYLIDEFPSTCGFAGGLSRAFTLEKAICEAVERWVRSKWIDDHFFIEQTKFDNSFFSRKEIFFLDHFVEARFYKISNAMKVEGCVRNFETLITVCFTNTGAFVGSDTQLDKSARLEHALLESWRHLQISRDSKNTNEESIVVKYFANNKIVAIDQIEKANIKKWPKPKLRLLKEITIPIDGFYCFRALCYDFRGWHGNDYKRFVY